MLRFHLSAFISIFDSSPTLTNCEAQSSFRCSSIVLRKDESPPQSVPYEFHNEIEVPTNSNKSLGIVEKLIGASGQSSGLRLRVEGTWSEVSDSVWTLNFGHLDSQI